MADDAQIAKTLNRVARVFKEKPSAAPDTDRASVTLVDGLKCTVRQGQHSAVIDMPAMMGGPVAMAIKRFSAGMLGEVRQEFLASASESRNPDGSYSIQGEFVTVVGTVPD